jgi:preprotein translocase subunit SecA
LPIAKWLEQDSHLHEESLRKKVIDEVQSAYDAKCERVGDLLLEIEKQLMLQVLDNAWKEQLASMDHLRQGINLRSYAQRNPKQEYKRESFELFQSMLSNVKRETVHLMARVEPISREQMEAMEQQRRDDLARQKVQLQHDQASALPQSTAQPKLTQAPIRSGRKVGRNDPCPCGSGKKFKSCHGALE